MLYKEKSVTILFCEVLNEYIMVLFYWCGLDKHNIKKLHQNSDISECPN